MTVPSAFCNGLFCWGIWKTFISVKTMFPGYLKHYLYDTNDHFPCTPTSDCKRILALYWLHSFWCMGNFSALFVQDLAQWGCGPSLWLLSASVIQIMLSPLKDKFVKCKHVWIEMMILIQTLSGKIWRWCLIISIWNWWMFTVSTNEDGNSFRQQMQWVIYVLKYGNCIVKVSL